jgi:hypothetical protein
MKRVIFVISAILMLASCGGGELSSGNSPTDLTISLSTDHIDSNNLTGDENIDVTADCSSGDLFAKECLLRGVTVSWGEESLTYPLNYRIKIGESKKFALTLISDSERILEPFSYLSDANPTISNSNWTAYSETVGKIGSTLFATGSQTCSPDPNDATKEICAGVKSYAGYLPNYTRGTLKITDGDQVLEESTFGVLSGSGSGYIDSKNYLRITFSNEPQANALITASYIQPLSALKHIPKGNDIKMVYGDLKMGQEDVNGKTYLLNEGDKVPYAQVVDTAILPIQSWGFKNAAVTVSYSAAPYNGSGGEVIGSGDGRSTLYHLKTKYAPIVDGSLKVFTASQAGEIQYYNRNTGEVTVAFKSAVPAIENIKASYYISHVSVPMSIAFESDNGVQKFNVLLEVTKK